MISAYESIDLVERCILSGADAYMLKPLRMHELRNIWQCAPPPPATTATTATSATTATTATLHTHTTPPLAAHAAIPACTAPHRSAPIDAPRCRRAPRARPPPLRPAP